MLPALLHMRTRALLYTTLLLAVLALPGRGIILIGPDQSDNLLPPPDPSRWSHVGRLDNQFGARGTGLYLGNRYVLTANHVDLDVNLLHLNGVNYAKDNSFTPIQIGGVDLRLMRITTDPGLPALPLIGAGNSELNLASMMIGYGVGKGTVVPGQGWNWADNTTTLKRWGTNVTEAAYFTPPGGPTYVPTAFDLAAGLEEAQLTIVDSGCGLFQIHGGVWKLVGVGVDVDTLNQALYDHTPGTPGNQPDRSYFLPILPHRALLTGIRSGYTAWAAGFSPNPGAVGANPDGDAFTNLQEFAFGLDPLVANSAPLSISPTVVRGRPTTSIALGPMIFSGQFVRRDDFATAGLTYTFQSSADLVTWVDSIATPTVIADSGEYEIVAVSFSFPAGNKLFFRVAVTME